MVTWASKCGSQIENNPTSFRCVPSEMLAAAWDRAAELCDKVQGALGVDNAKFLLDSDPEELKVSASPKLPNSQTLQPVLRALTPIQAPQPTNLPPPAGDQDVTS